MHGKKTRSFSPSLSLDTVLFRYREYIDDRSDNLQYSIGKIEFNAKLFHFSLSTRSLHDILPSRNVENVESNALIKKKEKEKSNN